MDFSGPDPEKRKEGATLIEVKDLVKRYGGHLAVDHLSFSVGRGQVYGFLGPNGAGKSTTMNIITGCLAATEGTVTIGGKDIYQDAREAKRLIGYLPEQPPLYQDMTPWEYLCFVAEAKGTEKNTIAPQVRAVMDQTGITDVQDRLIKFLSKGYKQRVGIAQALLGNPEVIILDEPTVGLDPKQIIEIRELIQELGQKHTVILSSHILSEVSNLCDTILIINKGKLVACDTPENLARLLTGSNTLSLQVRGGEDSIRTALETLPDRARWELAPGEEGLVQVTVSWEEEEDLRETVFFALADARLPILSMNLQRASLEDVFLELTEEPEPEQIPEEPEEEPATEETANEAADETGEEEDHEGSL